MTAVYMHHTLANERMVLSRGDVYDLPRGVAKRLCEQDHIVGLTDPSKEKDGVGKPILQGKTAVLYDPAKHGKRPILRVPYKPDPEDRPEAVEEDFDLLEDDE